MRRALLIASVALVGLIVTAPVVSARTAVPRGMAHRERAHHAIPRGIADGPLGAGICTVATGPSGDATPFAGKAPTPAPTNLDDLDLTAVGMKTAGSELLVYVKVLNLGNAAGEPAIYGFGDWWAMSLVGPRATLGLSVLWPGVQPAVSAGMPEVVVTQKGVPVAYESGAFDMANNQIIMTIPLSDVGLRPGDRLVAPSASSWVLLTPFPGAYLPAGSPDPTPSQSPYDLYSFKVSAGADGGMNSTADYIVGKNC